MITKIRNKSKKVSITRSGGFTKWELWVDIKNFKGKDMDGGGLHSRKT